MFLECLCLVTLKLILKLTPIEYYAIVDQIRHCANLKVFISQIMQTALVKDTYNFLHGAHWIQFGYNQYVDVLDL